MNALEDHEVVQMVLLRLGKRFPEPPVPLQAVEEDVDRLRASGLFDDLTDDDWSTVGKIVKSRVKITMDVGTSLTAPDVVDWLSDRYNDIDWKRWVSYKQLLIEKGFAPNVLATLDASTSEILNCLGDPTRPGSWKRRGLVIGDVQSGKTATYLGAVNRAADAGYKLIILLAGGTEALRKQTQFRVDEGLFGRDTSKDGKAFGVGKWHGNFVSAQAMTTQAADFRKTSKQAASIVVDPDSPTPLVYVIKKNKTALENVRDWIRSQQTGEQALDVPILLVDDESDYASVNTRDEDSPTVINALIREILGLATKTSYLAFTATPFANVFIDHETEDELLGDDLFPSDYIRVLDAPSNYVGSGAYFGTEEDADSAKLVSLHDANHHFPFKHKSHLVVPGLPSSLLEAIRTFVLASAIREARGDTSPRSMLVNVSRFKNVQAQVHGMVEAEFERIKSAVELHAVGIGGRGGEHEEIESLRLTFVKHYSEAGHSWEVVRQHLKAAVQGTAVKLINSERVQRAKDLDEVEADRMIAVGGDVLSRGLTLDGLTVSYFHRLVGASDTLLQMARWFGYRPGYDDICRVWIPDDVADQFRYVAGIVDDLRAQLRAMKKQGMTPRDFGLRVRMHPESLLITARNKMKAAEAKAWTINVAGAKNLETVRVSPDSDDVRANLAAVQDLVKRVEAGHSGTPWDAGRGTIRATAGVDREIVADFLESYVAFVADPFFADSALSAFVRTTQNAKFHEWIVGFVPGYGDEERLSDTLSLKRVSRGVGSTASVTVGSKTHAALRVSGKSSRLAGGNDIARAGSVPVEWEKEPAVYEHLDRPVLLVYLLQPEPKKETTADGDKVPDAVAAELLEGLDEAGLGYIVGVKVGIPGAPGDKGADVKYMLNSVALGAWSGAAFEEPVEDLDEVDGGEDA